MWRAWRCATATFSYWPWVPMILGLVWMEMRQYKPSVGGCGNKKWLVRRRGNDLFDAGAGGCRTASSTFHGETIMISDLDLTGSTRWFLISFGTLIKCSWAHEETPPLVSYSSSTSTAGME